MATTVLGKRQRTTVEIEGKMTFQIWILSLAPLSVTDFTILKDTLPLRSGSKRRARTPKIHEEKEDSDTSTTIRLRSRVVDSSTLQDAVNTNTNLSTSRTSRSKRNVQNNDTRSPSHKDTHLESTTKALDSMFSALICSFVFSSLTSQ